MKLTVFYDKNKPEKNLVYLTTFKKNIELEKIELDVDFEKNILKQIYEFLKVPYKENEEN
jgi:hypothetical protein